MHNLSRLPRKDYWMGKTPLLYRPTITRSLQSRYPRAVFLRRWTPKKACYVCRSLWKYPLVKLPIFLPRSLLSPGKRERDYAVQEPDPITKSLFRPAGNLCPGLSGPAYRPTGPPRRLPGAVQSASSAAASVWGSLLRPVCLARAARDAITEACLAADGPDLPLQSYRL